MSIANIFDIITKPMMNRYSEGLSELTGHKGKSGFADMLKSANLSSEWAEITGLQVSGALESALLKLQEHGDVTDARDLWEEMSEGQSLDDKLMENPEYIAASISASMKFGATGDRQGLFGSSDNKYGSIFGGDRWQFQALAHQMKSGGPDQKSEKDISSLLQARMYERMSDLFLLA